ncbi:MAG: hypothetical protein QNK20_12310 [Aureibaculum sp.]|nr:hypothetical protein [Aureibaculum sp.]
MKTKKNNYVLLLSFLLLLIPGCQNTDYLSIDDDLVLEKSGNAKVMPSKAKDVLIKAQEDWQSINNALQDAKSGEVIQLGEGLFYLHKSIIRWNFNGTLKGSGMDKTTIQTMPGKLFDRIDSPPIDWKLESNDGGFMFCFPHDFTEDERTVTVSDLSIVVSEPTTPYLRWKNSDKEMEFNSLQAITVYYENMDNDMENPIHMNVFYKNITITGEKDEKYNYNSYSVFQGLSAFGASSGTFEAKNVWIENASGCINPHAFYGDNATVTVKNAHLKSCHFGIFSFLNHSWTILNNEIEDSWRSIVLLKRNAWGELVDGPDGSTFVKNNRIQFTNMGLGVQYLNNVEVKNNVIEGSGIYGGIASIFGDNWIIKDNDLCGVPVPPNNCTIFLYNLTNSEIKNNANQIIGGPGASEPTNIIGEGSECH